MAIWLKEGKSESEIIEADEKVKRTVLTNILKFILESLKLLFAFING